MAGCNRVLSDTNGPSNARIMFIGEAPGRLGAERTAIPFHGDVAGDNFERLLSLAGLSRSEVFVTNSILCNPTDDKGNNAPPSKRAIRHCSNLLRDQIEVINPDIIVTLGAAALNALTLVCPHTLTVSESVRTMHDWNGRKLIPLYHPGARAMIHRNFAAQTADYYFVGESYRRLFSKRAKTASVIPPRAGWEIVRYVLSEMQVLSLFKLHKIMYLLDYRYLKDHDSKLTDFFYIRQKDGPYCVELGSRWYKKFESVDVSFRSGKPILNWNGGDLFSERVPLAESLKAEVDELLSALTQLSESELKTRAYLTSPMKRALRAERVGLIGLNRALI
nr:uracil-DNA glycosylase family protein [Aquisediminimonas profunda]